MNDSTSRVCALPECNVRFKPKNAVQKYCHYKHQALHNSILNKVKIKKIKKEMDKYKWQQSKLSKLNKFYELFGEKFNCDVCGIGFNDSIDKYGIPFFIELIPDIRDHRVLEVSSWHRYCYDCYLKIKELRLKEEN